MPQKPLGYSPLITLKEVKARLYGEDGHVFQKPIFEVLREGYLIAKSKKIRYSCAPCRPGYGEEPVPCAAACEPGAISHSDRWKLQYGK